MNKAAKKSTSLKKIPGLIKKDLIAPCGMNCALCIGFLRDKNRCPGCVPGGVDMSEFCKRCIIRNCDNWKKAKRHYCFDCNSYPCARLKRLDKRYRTRYGMSMLLNLESIRCTGIREFVENEKARWTCRHCGNILSVHRGNCLFCGHQKSIEQLMVRYDDNTG